MKRRRLGQHWLVDDELLKGMVKSANVSKNDIVFEMGSGTGNLTEILCKRAKKVFSYEIDKSLFSIAKSRLIRFKNLKLINGDALESGYKFNKLISNIPYSKSGKFIEWLSKKDFDKAIVTVQKEFADKLLSQTGSKYYRAITIIARSSFEIEPLKLVGREAFEPRPRVTSLILLLKPKQDRMDDSVILYTKLLFSFRGKKVVNAIKTICEKYGKDYDAMLKKLDSETQQKRVEHLEVEESVRMAKELSSL
ncbi:MAG: ribosomal RNA small subunit methyltransferase A [Nitrososphaerales archaeon]|nr:ribosomal RNA small subunit methyltransferase A [Nitrososphaerales archaeon]